LLCAEEQSCLGAGAINDADYPLDLSRPASNLTFTDICTGSATNCGLLTNGAIPFDA
jgi:argininosuccinate lyase